MTAPLTVTVGVPATLTKSASLQWPLLEMPDENLRCYVFGWQLGFEVDGERWEIDLREWVRAVAAEVRRLDLNEVPIRIDPPPLPADAATDVS